VRKNKQPHPHLSEPADQQGEMREGIREEKERGKDLKTEPEGGIPERQVRDSSGRERKEANKLNERQRESRRGGPESERMGGAFQRKRENDKAWGVLLEWKKILIATSETTSKCTLCAKKKGEGKCMLGGKKKR